MNDVKVFYQNEDLWEISNEIYGMEEQAMTPNYYIMKLPGEESAEFVNSIPFTPRDKNNLMGLMVARNDGENYGELILYQMPKSRTVYGPMQVEAQIDQNTEISQEFSLWNSSGSNYSRGNMFVVPIEDSLLYIEPVYLEATNSSIPEVKRVIVAYGDRIAYEPTLAEALNSLFGEGSAQESPGKRRAAGGRISRKLTAISHEPVGDRNQRSGSVQQGSGGSAERRMGGIRPDTWSELEKLFEHAWPVKVMQTLSVQEAFSTFPIQA